MIGPTDYLALTNYIDKLVYVAFAFTVFKVDKIFIINAIDVFNKGFKIPWKVWKIFFIHFWKSVEKSAIQDSGSFLVLKGMDFDISLTYKKNLAQYFTYFPLKNCSTEGVKQTWDFPADRIIKKWKKSFLWIVHTVT